MYVYIKPQNPEQTGSRIGLVKHGPKLQNWTLLFCFLLFRAKPASFSYVTLVASCLFLDSRLFSRSIFNSTAYWQFVNMKLFSSELMQFYRCPVWGLNQLADNVLWFFSFLLATHFRHIPWHIFSNTISIINITSCMFSASCPYAEKSVSGVMLVILPQTAEKRNGKIFGHLLTI